MAMDMQRFVQTFLDESFEGLDVFEAGLLNLEPGDEEAINTLFRAAHSIKGGAGTFGFSAVAAFTHKVETVLGEMREGERVPDGPTADVLLQAGDCIRSMLTAARDDGELDAGRIAEVEQALDELLAGEGGAAAVAGAAEAGAPADGGPRRWQIEFRPEPQILSTGNDPLRMFQALAELGELKAECDLQALPDLRSMEPEACRLAWTLTLEGNCAREAVAEVFEWVEDECELTIDDVTPRPAAELSVAPPPVERRAGADRRQGDRRQGDRRQGDRRGGGPQEGGSIRVGIEKVDAIINLVGELVITQSMLSTLGTDFDEDRLTQLRSGLVQLERNTRELQESVMRMRMLPIASVFQRFPRLVHDTAQNLGKQIELRLLGEQTELDKTVIEKISDPLVHLVRNSMDHGLEAPEERRAAGKPETGHLTLNAYHKGGNIVIEVRDDGRGIDFERLLAKARKNGMADEAADYGPDQLADLIFMPGLSTAEAVSDLSGRGVGMDVVRRNVQSMGGTVEVSSEPGVGTLFTVKLPLTLAILDGQLIAVGEERYIIPLVSIVESLQVSDGSVRNLAGKGDVFQLREEVVPVLRLDDVFGTHGRAQALSEGLLVVVEAEGQRTALFVDELLGQQQIVIKSLEANYRPVDGVSGATILGDGLVALILDVPGLVRLRDQTGPRPSSIGVRS
jgi:two-component system chemotaxis sensor kinase CheA